MLVIDGFQIGIEGVGDVRTLDLQEKLAFFYVVIQARQNIHDATAGQ